ncbi:Hypothetical protein FKW44_008821, partial [Caligus rogercresseyi]
AKWQVHQHLTKNVTLRSGSCKVQAPQKAMMLGFVGSDGKAFSNLVCGSVNATT